MSTTEQAPPAPTTTPERPGRKSLFWPLGYTLFVAVWALLFLRHNIDYGLDDSFISYRYARNFADGYGLVFNPGERFFGTTAAGYATTLGLLHMLMGSAIPKLSVALTTLGVVALAACLPTIARGVPGSRRWLISAIFTVAAFTLGPFSQVAGHETVPFLAVGLLGTMCLGYWSKPLLGGILLAVATTFRPDAALLAALAGLCMWVSLGTGFGAFLRSRELRRYLLGYILPLAGLGGVPFVAVLNRRPGNAGRKASPGRPRLLAYLQPGPMWTYLFGFLGVLGLTLARGPGRSFIRPTRQALFLLIVWLGFTMGAAAFYTAIGVTFWFWYATPLFFALFLAAFVGWSNLAGLRFGWLAVGVCALALVGQTPAIGTWLNTPNLKPHIHAYEQAADFIKAESPGGATILMPEPGSFGMRLGPDFTVSDQLRRISAGVAQALLRGETAGRRAGEAAVQPAGRWGVRLHVSATVLVVLAVIGFVVMVLTALVVGP